MPDESRFLQRLRSAGERFGLALTDLTLTQQLILFGVLVGLAAGLSAYAFDSLIVLATRLSLANLDQAALPWRIAGLLLLPAAGAFFGAALIRRFCPEAKGHGVNEVLEAISKKDGAIRSRVAWVKSAASALTIGLGGSAGREGPVIQIGAAAGSWVGRRLRVSAGELKVLAAAGASAGLAAAFGTPLAAVFFTMEVVLKDLASESFAGVVIASVTAVATARFLLGSGRFMVPLNYTWNGPLDFVLYGALGLLCGPMGSLYMRCLHGVERWTEGQTRLGRFAPAAGGVFVGLIAIFLPHVLGTGQATINAALTGTISGPRAGALALAKVAATSATLGTGGSGGALMPSLFIGATAGAAWGSFFQFLFGPGIQYGAFALVGMACAFTGAFQAPVTAMIFALEVSQDYDILLPVMFACVVAYLTTRRRREAPTIEQ